MRIDRVKFAVALAKADITVKELSGRSGVSRVTVTSVKGGKRCSELTAQRLAAGLGVSVEDITETEG